MSKREIHSDVIHENKPNNQQKVRLVDIAQRANVSVSSVSRVIRRIPNIDENIREKVEKAITDMKLDMNNFCKKAPEISPKYKFIAILMNNIADPYYLSLVKGIKHVANMHQFDIILSDTNDFENNYQKMKDLIQEYGLAGAILFSADSTRVFMENILKDKIPLVLTENIDKQTEQAYLVACDDRGGACNAVRYLISLGHRRIMYLSGDARLNSEKARYSGYCDALNTEGIPIDPELKTPEILDYQEVYDNIDNKIKKNTNFSAIFCSNDLTAFAAKQALQDNGLLVPEDISLMGFDDSPLASALSLTTCLRPAYEIGRNAMLMLLDLINKRTVPERHVIQNPTIKIRNSCGRNHKYFEESARKITAGRTIKIGFTPPASSEFYDIIKHGAYTMMKELTDRFDVKFEFETSAPSEHKQVKSQVDIINNWVEKKYDAILVCSAGDFDTMNEVYEKAENAGTAIYLFNMPSELWKETNLNVTCVISYNNHYQAGTLVGKYAAEKLNGKGKILLVWGFPGHWSVSRKEGFMEAIKPYPGLQIVGEQYGDYVREKGMQAAMELLAEHPDVDLIYGENEEMAQGAVQAIEACGMKHWDGTQGIITIGADGLKSGYESIRNNKLTATLNVGPVDQGREFIMAVFMNEALGYNVDKIINVTTTVVDKSNVDSAAGYTEWALGTEYP